MTVVFADIAGSTHLTEKLDAEAALGLIGPAIAAMADAVERFGGTVTKRMGDGLMAIFGVPTMLEDHAARACHAASALQAEIARYGADVRARHGADLRVRVGLHSGPVVVASVADGLRTDYDAIGPTVHYAQRVESVAEPGSVYLSEATYRLVRRVFDCRPVGLHSLKGFAEPQPMYRLVRARQSTDEAPADFHALATPLVGRDEQLAALEEVLARLAAGTGGIVLVTGEAGVGKSRLLDETKRRAPTAIRWLEGHALSFGQRLSYWPFVEALKGVFNLVESSDARANWAILEGEIARLFGEERAEIAPYVATLLGFEVPPLYADRVRHLDGELLGRQIARAMRRLFERLARERPVSLVIEDLHWVDGSSAALVDHLLPLAAEVPILFYVLGRPEQSARRFAEVAHGAAPGRVCEIALAPLSVKDSVHLITHLIDDDPRTARVRDLILYKAEGNPFFMEEVVRALIDLKVLVRDEARGTWLVRDREIAIPDTIQGVILARVDRLDERLKNVLGIASVIGRTFFYRVLHAVSDQNSQLDERLTALRSVEFIDEMKSAPELAYLFRHALAHEAVYESLLIESRKRLHDKIAGCLRDLYVDRPHEISSLLAYHYARAENWGQALQHLLAAADQSARMAADDEALLHYEEALQAYKRARGADWDKAQQATIQRRLGEIYMRRGDPERALTHLSAALQLFGDSFPQNRRQVRLGFVGQIMRQLAHRALPALLVARPVEQVEPGDEAHLRIYEVLSWVFFSSDQERLIFVILKILNLAEKVGMAEGASKASGAFGFALDLLGQPRFARRYHDRALALAERVNNPATLGIAHVTLGTHYFYLGQWDEARRYYRPGRELVWIAGDLITWSAISMMTCQMLIESSQFEQAYVEAGRMIDTGREAAFHPALRWGLTARGQVLRHLGRLDEARAALDDALRMCADARDSLNLCLTYGEMALCRLELGEIDAALADAAEGDRIATTEQVRTFSPLVAQLALAMAHLRQWQRQETRSKASLRAARQASRRALKTTARVPHGRGPAWRIAGTIAWLEGRRGYAARAWQKSADASEHFGGRYQLALLLIERGQCLGRQDEVAQGNTLLAELRNVPALER